MWNRRAKQQNDNLWKVSVELCEWCLQSFCVVFCCRCGVNLVLVPNPWVKLVPCAPDRNQGTGSVHPNTRQEWPHQGLKLKTSWTGLLYRGWVINHPCLFYFFVRKNEAWDKITQPFRMNERVILFAFLPFFSIVALHSARFRLQALCISSSHFSRRNEGNIVSGLSAVYFWTLFQFNFKEHFYKIYIGKSTYSKTTKTQKYSW